MKQDLTRDKGLYRPEFEHDACGVGFIARLHNDKSHAVVQKGLQLLCNLTHRGAVGADPDEGDGAGIMIQLPDAFLRAVAASVGLATLPAEGDYAVGMVFLPQSGQQRARCKVVISQMISEEKQQNLGWRPVPTDAAGATLPASVRACEPVVEQLFIGRGDDCAVEDFERKLFVIRKRIEHAVQALQIEDPVHFYIASLSSRTLVYKGMFLSHQLGQYYSDLHDVRMVSALAVVHQRFSTNTFPSWELAHPFRMVAHNGEINTVKGNTKWMAARRHTMHSEVLGDDLDKIWPLIDKGQSDTACFDNALELLVAGGYDMAHAAMMLIPEAWSGHQQMDPKLKAFYEYHAALMEPWDGPAAVAFTDGRYLGACLDRNGLRPARYLVTDDGTVVMASEMGVLPIDETRIVKKWRLQPGKMLLLDLQAGRIIDDVELKQELAGRYPYEQWLHAAQIQLDQLAVGTEELPAIADDLLPRQQMFGTTQEDIKMILEPMMLSGMEPTGSMGNDAALAVLSNRSRHLASYFRQRFAQVTNPAIDPIREEMVMSLASIIGPRPNLLDQSGVNAGYRLEVGQPLLRPQEYASLQDIARLNDHFTSQTLSMCYPAEQGSAGMEQALTALCEQAEQGVRGHANILILSDADAAADRLPIPALLATSAVHHHLVRQGLRTETGLVVATGSAREIQHFCTLVGYGAEAIYPYLSYDSIRVLSQSHDDLDEAEAINRYIKAVNKGMLKVMSKMGISTLQSYCGAQIFEAVGLSQALVDRYFTGTISQIEGVSLSHIATEAVRWHSHAYGDEPIYRNALDVGGEYAWRVRGEAHAWTAETIGLLQHAVRSGDAAEYRRFADIINQQNGKLLTLRGLFELNTQDESIPLSEVESAASIVKRFATGAMSFGSISHEAHSTLAIAMNRLGGKSNTGEGGEDPERFRPKANGDSMRSAIKQVASGRFGVTAEYLVNADEIQIKISQGAKPGEGGQLPGHKVNDVIARVRHATPGVGLISPPPHHDIYSIEDIAQLIYDLKNVNPEAGISVKLVSEIGVGTVAAGVVKGHADHVTIAGHDGGTGASPMTSIKNAGTPWELGLSETQQTLVRNGLRSRVRVQVDGQMRTGRDVIIGALLGADEFGFGTIALVAEGCIMMRKCHLNTCPVGVATQDEKLRKRFSGKPEDVVNYFMFVAEDVREWMARLGVRRFDDLIGQTQHLRINKAVSRWKSEGLDLTPILASAAIDDDPKALYHNRQQDHGLEAILDRRLMAEAQPALDKQQPVVIETAIANSDRSAGTMLSGEIARRYGSKGLPEGSIHLRMRGVAGQSFGAWLAKGVSIELHGEANDYVGKGLSGGTIAIMPPENSRIVAEDSIIVGNTVLYGAIDGRCFFNGIAGERFAVRNSGALAIVEGVGDHGCEYMTGGTVVVLGSTGRNFAAGMSGGVAYVLDTDGHFASRCNLAMVALEPVDSEADAWEALASQGNDLEAHGQVSLQHSLNQNDARILYWLIMQHRHHTNSAKARHILTHWADYRGRFVKVLPVDYHRALQENAEKDAATEAAQHG